MTQMNKFSPEDIPTTVEQILNNSNLREAFREFLTGHVAEELIKFYEEVERFEQMNTQQLRNKAGLKIVQMCIVSGSDWEVNLSDSIRSELRDIQIFTPEAFCPAKTEVLSLMASNFLDDFRKCLKGEEDPHRCSTLSVVKQETSGKVTQPSVGTGRKAVSVIKQFKNRMQRTSRSQSIPELNHAPMKSALSRVSKRSKAQSLIRRISGLNQSSETL